MDGSRPVTRSQHTLAETTSLCPSCLGEADGAYVERDGRVHLERTCPEHGTIAPQVWGSVDHWRWAQRYAPENPPTGDLQVTNSHACLAVVEVTQRCNLECPYCFAASGPHGRELPFKEVVELLEVVAKDGGPRPIQFSGGEPTIREDLPELIRTAREMGFGHIEVNTNGLVIAHREGYAQALKEAGATAIYLQFDGFETSTYESTRGKDLTSVKQAAIEACREAELPVILVATVVPGTNDHEMGEIVRFALSNRDVVRSVNLQPVARFGRHQDETGQRFSLDLAAERLASQLKGLEAKDLLPVPCCSAYCQAATALLPAGDDQEDEVIALTRFIQDEWWEELSGLVDEADWMELLAGTPQAQDRAAYVAGCCGIQVPQGTDALIAEVLPVALTGFMDADGADVDRLQQCCIGVPTRENGMVPFCAYNMTTRDGAYAMRNRYGWGGRERVDSEHPGDATDAKESRRRPPTPREHDRGPCEATDARRTEGDR